MSDKNCKYCNLTKPLKQFRAGRNECLHCECTKRCNRYKTKKQIETQITRDEFIKEHPKIADGILEVFFEQNFKWVFIYEETFNKMMIDLKEKWIAKEFPKEIEHMIKKHLTPAETKAVKYIRRVTPENDIVCIENCLDVHLII